MLSILDSTDILCAEALLSEIQRHGSSSVQPLYMSVDIKKLVNSIDCPVFELIAQLEQGLSSGVIFLKVPSYVDYHSVKKYDQETVTAFNFYSKDFTERDRQRAISSGSYRVQDFYDDIGNITVFRTMYNVQDISQMIRYWLNRWCYADGIPATSQVKLLYNGIEYEI